MLPVSWRAVIRGRSLFRGIEGLVLRDENTQVNKEAALVRRDESSIEGNLWIARISPTPSVL
jgi:hypothetical protein